MKNILSYNIDIYDDDYSEFNKFEKILKKPSIYFVEDSPAKIVNYDIFINNIKYLYKSNNIKYIVTEFSYSEALWINYLMNDENFTDLIKPILYSYENSYLNSHEYYNLLSFIKNYNDSFRENKIEIIGINPEKSITFAANYINHLFDQFINKRRPNEINQAFNFIADNELDYYQNMYNSLLSNERIYREYFVNQFFSFNLLLKNIVNTNNSIYIDNFVDIYNQNIRVKYYLQLPDNMKFYEKITQEYPQFMNEIAYIKLFYDDENFMNDNTQNVFILNNKVFKYFEKHKRFVYDLNNRHYESYNTDYGDNYIIATNSQTITPMEIIDDFY